MSRLGPDQIETYTHPMIRVNQAGEMGATRIYAGQLAALGHDPELKAILDHMAEQEQDHLTKFNKMMVERRVRPTALSPLWSILGFGLGYMTAKFSKEAAMACTVAVEEVIEEHYQEQLDALQSVPEEQALRDLIKHCQADEIAHRDEALVQGAEQTPGYSLLTGLIKGGVKTAIWLSKRI